jgi:hypothetical protein
VFEKRRRYLIEQEEKRIEQEAYEKEMKIREKTIERLSNYDYAKNIPIVTKFKDKIDDDDDDDDDDDGIDEEVGIEGATSPSGPPPPPSSSFGGIFSPDDSMGVDGDNHRPANRRLPSKRTSFTNSFFVRSLNLDKESESEGRDVSSSSGGVAPRESVFKAFTRNHGAVTSRDHLVEADPTRISQMEDHVLQALDNLKEEEERGGGERDDDNNHVENGRLDSDNTSNNESGSRPISSIKEEGEEVMRSIRKGKSITVRGNVAPHKTRSHQFVVKSKRRRTSSVDGQQQQQKNNNNRSSSVIDAVGILFGNGRTGGGGGRNNSPVRPSRGEREKGGGVRGSSEPRKVRSGGNDFNSISKEENEDTGCVIQRIKSEPKSDNNNQAAETLSSSSSSSSASQTQEDEQVVVPKDSSQQKAPVPKTKRTTTPKSRRTPPPNHPSRSMNAYEAEL